MTRAAAAIGLPAQLPPATRAAGAATRPWGWSWERAGRWLFFAALLAAAPVALNRAIQHLGGTDFPEYYAAGAHVLAHGLPLQQAMTAYYLPSVDIAWAGLALLPLPAAAAVWYLGGCAAWIALVQAIRHYLLAACDETTRRQATLAAGLLVTPLVADQLCIGAFHGLMLWLMVAGLGRASQGRCWSGGILLGLGIWLKLLPALGVVYLLLKRKWLAAATAVVVAAAFDLLLCLAVFGQQATWELHDKWLHRDAAGTAEALLTSPKLLNEQRVTNQSLPVVLRRTLTQLGVPSHSSRDLAVVGNLSGPQLKMVYGLLVGVIILALGWFFRRPWHRLSAEDWSHEIALLVLSTLWFSPIAPSYHPIAAAPALAVLIAHHMHQRLGWAVVGLWSLAMILHAVPTARAFGHVLWMTMALGLLLAWNHRRLKASQLRTVATPTSIQKAGIA